MATKEQWVELVNLKLSGGDAPATIEGKYSLAEIEHYLTLAFNDVLSAAWMQDRSILDDYIRSKVFDVKNDLNRNERYISIDVIVLPLNKNAGYAQLRYLKNPKMQFALIDANALAVFSELEVSRIDSRVGFYAEGQNIYFDENLPKIVDQILLKYITSFGGLDDTDEVIVPGGNNKAVMDALFQLMSKPLPSVNQDNMVDKQV
jgi:hypothetical protein